MRGWILTASMAVYLLFIPEFTRHLMFENRLIVSGAVGSPAAFAVLLLRYRDKADQSRGDQGFGPFRKLLRAILTEDKHAASASGLLIVTFVGLVNIFGTL